MRAALFALLSLSLAAQATPAPLGFDETFFAGDRRAVLQGCADKVRALKPKDAKYLAECGRAYLAALDKPKAEAAFKEAEARESKDGEVLQLIAVAWLKNEAERYMNALAAQDKDWRRFLQFGRALLVAGQRKKAAPWFARAVALKPGEEKLFLEISRAFAETQSVM